MLVALLLPAVQAAREAARKTQCQNHLKQWSLALHTYHDAKSELPPFGLNLKCSDNGQYGISDGHRGISWIVWMLNFVEQQSIYAMIESGGTAVSVNGTTNYPASTNGQICPGVPYDTNYLPWTLTFPILFCPSDAVQNYPGEWWPASSNYRACTGDMTIDWTNAAGNLSGHYHRGTFRRDIGRNFNDVTDGTSNTIALSEGRIATTIDRDALSWSAGNGIGSGSPDWCLGAVDTNDKTRFKSSWHSVGNNGRRWADGQEWHYTSFNTIMTPNSPTVVLWGSSSSDLWKNATICPPSSYHTSGVNVSFVDGSVRFIGNTINVGSNTSRETWSDRNGDATWWGVWGALGSIDGGEVEAAP